MATKKRAHVSRIDGEIIIGKYGTFERDRKEMAFHPLDATQILTELQDIIGEDILSGTHTTDPMTLPQSFDDGYRSVLESLQFNLQCARENIEAAENIEARVDPWSGRTIGDRVDYWRGRILAIEHAIGAIVSQANGDIDT